MAQPEFGDTQEFGASTWQARVPRHFVYPLTGGVPPSTMIERRERAVFGWRFVFSWLRDEIGRDRVSGGGEQRGQFPLAV
jgi:hypothetical protein